MTHRPDAVVPILRSGLLARQFCQRVAFANVEAVFARCLYLRRDDDFVCIGAPDIGNGPLTLIANVAVLSTLRSLAGQAALVSGDGIAIGNSVRFSLDQSELWRPLRWPPCPPLARLTNICALLASRAATAAPQEGLARCVIGENPAPLARVVRPRIAMFKRWLSDLRDGRPVPAAASREAVQGLIGLGPGLTPSGDDFLAGALALLDAIGEREAHDAMARAILDALGGRTTPLSGCLLRAAAAGHVGEKLHQIVSLLMTGDIDAAIAGAGKIGHSSGWDMIAGVLTALRIAAVRSKIPPAACTLDGIFSKDGILNADAA